MTERVAAARGAWRALAVRLLVLATVAGCGSNAAGRPEGGVGGRDTGSIGGGSGGGAAGTSGAAGTGGLAGTTGVAGAGSAGAAGSFQPTDGGLDGAGDLGPVRLVIFYTRWGTAYPDWWPTGSERQFTLGPILEPLAPFKDDLVVLSGLTNATIISDAEGGQSLRATGESEAGEAMATLLTARRRGEGPSFDTVVGDCGGAAGPPLRLTVGKFANDLPGISFGRDGAPIPGERDPRAVATRLLGRTIDAPDPDGDIDTSYPALGAAHMTVLVGALAAGKTCAATLMWGDAVRTPWLDPNRPWSVHDLSHESRSLFDAAGSPSPASWPTDGFVRLQRFYAQQLASLLAQLRAVPLGHGTLLDRSVVLWISESGAGIDHSGLFVPVVIAGRGGGRLEVGRYLEIKARPITSVVDVITVWRTQGDLLDALGRIWELPSFGDPAITRQPFLELLR